nr:integrase, catalytic region, zinc finger, CCHC-type, peptidase aspartic, catalytic [Tanacetum cinerariifolium]
METLNIELDHKVTKLATENEHLKQTYKQLYDSIKSSRVRSKEQCDDLIKKVNLKSDEVSDLNARLQEKVLVITALKEQLDKLKGKAVLTKAVSLNLIDPELLKVDVTPIVPKLRKNRTAHTDYIRHTQEEAATLRKIIESERLLSPLNTSLDYACKYTRRIQELLMILQQTCPYLTAIGTKLETVTQKNTTKQIRHTAQFTKSESITVTTLPSTNLESNKPVISSTGVNLVSSASGSMSQDNTKNNRIRQTQKKDKKNKVEDHLRTVKSSLNKTIVVDSKATSSVLNSVSNVNSDFKCASSNGCLLSDNHDTCAYKNSVNASKKSKSVKTPVIRKASKTKSWLWHRRLSHLNFGAINHLARQGLVRGLSKLKFEKDHLCSACAMGKSTRKTHKPKSEDTNQKKLYLLYMDLCGPMHNETEFVNHTLGDYYEEVGISHETSVTCFPQQNGVVERRNRTLIEAARTMLIYAQAPLFLWVEAVATACFTQNRSIICLRHGKTPYELLHNKLPDLSFFYVFGALCYPINNSENLAMASEQRSSGLALNEMTPGTISLGLAPTTSPSTSYVSPSRNDWDLLFQLMFDELLNPPPSVVNQAPEVIAPIVEVIHPVNADLTSSPSSTTVEQDAPSTSTFTTPTETQSSIIPQDVGDDNFDIEVAHMGSDPLFSIPIPEVTSE